MTLAPAEGGITITTPGTIISGRHFTGRVNVLANNVTIKNSLIESQGGWGVLLGTLEHCNVNLVIQDTEIDGSGRKGSDATTAAINQYNYCKPDPQVTSSDPMAWTCTRCDLHDNEDGVKLSSRNLLQDSWIHNLYHPDCSHHSDGFQMSDGAWSTVRHNFIDVGAPGEPCTDGSMFIDAEVGWGGVHDVTLDNNLLKGGLYPVWIYDEQKSGPTQITGTISVTNNRVYRQSFSGPDVLLNNDGTYVHPFVQSGNAWNNAGAGGPAGQSIADLRNSGQG